MSSKRWLLVVPVLLALASPALAGDPWVLWEKREGPITSLFKNTWTVIGGYEGRPGCLAMRSQILSRIRRANIETIGDDTVVVKGSLGSRQTYACLPGGARPSWWRATAVD